MPPSGDICMLEPRCLMIHELPANRCRRARARNTIHTRRRDYPHVNHRSSNVLHAVIVGAGPYGLSLAAHLREAGVPFRIFGRAMRSWATQMPEGMRLKSDGFASNLSTGSVPFTLEDFCRLTRRPYHATQLPIAVEDFIAYGQEFARRFVPSLEECNITAIERSDDTPHAFRVTTETGDSFVARHVILATGVSLFQYMPSNLGHLPREMVTHTVDHHTFHKFRGHDVTVLGRGASSLNAAALLHEAGSRVTLVTRKHKIHIHHKGTPQTRSLYQRLRHPSSPLGSSLRSWLSCTMPGLFKSFPAPVRDLLVYKHLGPAGGSSLEGRVQGKFPLLLGWSIVGAELMDAPNTNDRRIRLLLTNVELETREHITSHVIAGTGFRVDIKRYRFVADALLHAVRTRRNGAPILSRSFESSVKGLYMIGPVAQNSFGPLLRFAAGAEFAASQVTAQLLRDYAAVRTRAVPAFAPIPASTTIE